MSDTTTCQLCKRRIPANMLLCASCMNEEIRAADTILSKLNPTTSIFTKPANPVEGKDPSIKQALELEQQTYQLNEEFAREHPERINPNIAGTKSGEQVIREAESELKDVDS
jgi:hypothetical protein